MPKVDDRTRVLETAPKSVLMAFSKNLAAFNEAAFLWAIDLSTMPRKQGRGVAFAGFLTAGLL